MGRAPCCDKANVKKGPWSPEEDAQLKEYIEKQGTGGNWISLPQKAGLKRCGKSCRLRWLNYLRPNIKHGEFSDEEDRIICSLFVNIGSRWSIIAGQLPGRTDNDIKNYWNTKLKKKLMIIANNNNNLQKSQLSHHKMKSNNTSYNPMLHHMINSPSSQSPQLLSPAPSSSPPQYKSGDIYYNALSSSSLSFSGFDQSTLLGNSSNRLCASASSAFPNYLVFGGNPEPSCSSNSDGSCNINNNYTNKYDHFYNGSSLEEEDKKMGFLQNGIWEDTTDPLMDCGLEEIKQLISTTTSISDGDFNNCSSFNFDENKEGVLYY